MTLMETVDRETALKVKASTLFFAAAAPDATQADKDAYHAAQREYEEANRKVRAMLALGGTSC